MTRHPLSRPVRPRLELLEGRAVPAGNVTATLVGGRLVLTGDDQANGLTLTVTGTDVTVTPDATTSVNGQPAGTAVPLPGAARSLAANLAGGDDSLSIDNASPFDLAGAATINLGDGTNTLNLTTSQDIALGSLAVTSGPGSNTVTVNPTARGTVTGAASFVFGAGGSNTVTLSNTDFRGAAGVRVAAGSGGQNAVTATDVTVTRALSINAGRGGFQQFTNTTLGGLAVTGPQPSINLTGTTINGNLSAIGGSSAEVSTFDAVTVTLNVRVSGGQIGSFKVSGGSATINGNLSVTGRQVDVSVGTGGFSGTATFTAGSVSVSGGQFGSFRESTGSATINGNLSVTGGQQADVSFETGGGSGTATFTAGRVSVSGGQSGSFTDRGGSATIDGNLSVTSPRQASVGLETYFGSSVTASLTARNVSVSGGQDGSFRDIGARATMIGNLSVTSPQHASVDLANFGDNFGSESGTFAARNISVSGGQSGFFSASDWGSSSGPAGTTLDGNLSVTGGQSAFVNFNSNSLSEVRGNVAVRGGSLDTFFEATRNFQADGNVTVMTSAPNSRGTTVRFGDPFGGTAAVAVGGNLTVGAGNGPLSMTVTNLTVGGATRVTSLAGADTLTFNGTTFGGAFTANTGLGADTLAVDGTTFKAAFTANTGAGNDTFNIAQNATVTFGGPAMVNAGPGDDTLRLGVAGGSAADFTVPGSVLNGGAGLNTFFRSTSNFTGAPTFLNWTDA